jgi:hypothetical protein
MIETAVLAIFILEMVTLAAALWSLKTLAASRRAPEPGGSPLERG